MRNFFLEYLDEVIQAINKMNAFITVKNIRKFHDIDTKDKTRINIYWRILSRLSDNHLIKKYDGKSFVREEKHKKIKLSEVILIFFELKIRSNNNNECRNKDY